MSVNFSCGASLLSAASLVDCCVACQWQRHVFVVAPRLARSFCADGDFAAVACASSCVVRGHTLFSGAIRSPWVAARLCACPCLRHIKDPQSPEPSPRTSVAPRRRCSIGRGRSSIRCCPSACSHKRCSTSRVRQRLCIFVCLEPNKPASKDDTKTTYRDCAARCDDCSVAVGAGRAS